MKALKKGTAGKMKEYDVIVIGSGSGLRIANEAVFDGFKTALVDKGPLGGTCLNLGCIPSKMLIYPSDVAVEIKESEKLGLKSQLRKVDFKFIMERMRKLVEGSRKKIRKGIKELKNLDFYEGEGHFVDDYTIEVNGNKLKGKKIFIVSGARPLVPPIEGIEEVGFLNNESVLRISKQPESVIIIGGGYVGVEYAHFFSGIGTKVTLFEVNDRLIASEEPEICKLLKERLGKRVDIHTGTKIIEVKKKGSKVAVVAKGKRGKKEFTAEKIMLAAGRKPNSDLVRVKNTGVKTDKRGYIKVNSYLETSKKNIWAVGDAIGKQMFKHVANKEAEIAWHNASHKKRRRVDYSAAPHAVFSNPQVASVGMKEKEAKKEHKIVVGKAHYSDVAKGEAMAEKEGFAKAIVEKKTGKMLGFHVIGPWASILIQEVVTAMANNLTAEDIMNSMHIHPALSEVITAALRNSENAP